MIDWALFYADRGWPVVPLYTVRDGRCACGKSHEGDKSAGKHPCNGKGGLNLASTDREQITRWWQEWPDANIGLRTGVAFDVLDLDGLEACDALDNTYPDEPPLVGPMVRTGRGIHLYVAPTQITNKVRRLPSVDWRGPGGYVVAPPSVHYSGHRYEWTDLGPDTPLCEAPQWLRDLLQPPKRVDDREARLKALSLPQRGRGRRGGTDGAAYAEAALRGELERLRGARDGERNHTLNRAAYSLGQLVGAGLLDEAIVRDELEAVATALGLGGREIAATIDSGLTKGAGAPRMVA